jgi:hypothetical protein
LFRYTDWPHPYRVPGPRSEECQFTAEGWRSNAKLRLAAVAGRQFGRVRHDQIRALGVGETTIRRWRDDGYLHRVLPGVYAVGHTSPSVEADLAEALLYAGPGAMLSHGTAAWWLGLLKYAPDRQIVISGPRRVRNRDRIVVHGRRPLKRNLHRGLPVTTPSQTILDFAARGPADLLRLVLANADYQQLLDVTALQSMIGRGVAGSTLLKKALGIHLPELAHTRSELEVLLLTFCQSHGLPIPRVNVYVEGWLVDARWPNQRVVVEVDGWDGHRTRAQLDSDHRRDLELRAAGYVVLRYTWRQLIETPAVVAADLGRYLT